MSSLPAYVKIRLEGFAEQRESGLLRTEMESGPVKQVRIKSRVMVTRPVQLLFDTKADYLSFVTWYRDTIHEGADWFDFTDPVSNTTKSGRFDGNGIDAAPTSAIAGAWIIRGLKIESWGT